MKHLSTVARIITPLAMVVFLAYEINQSMTVAGLWQAALLIGSIGTAIGIEIVGILAGHALEGFWQLGDKNRTRLSLVLLVVYTAVAVYILRHNQAMVLVQHQCCACTCPHIRANRLHKNERILLHLSPRKQHCGHHENDVEYERHARASGCLRRDTR